MYVVFERCVFKRWFCRFATQLKNDVGKGGVGTAQPHLFLYICTNQGPKGLCRCAHCKRGRQMTEGHSSDSDDEILATWRNSVDDDAPATKKLK